MKTFQVEMFAFGDPGEIREVDVPDDELVRDDLTPWPIKYQLEKVYYWGQNDFQPKPHPSVSVGDVIRVEDQKWLITGGSVQLLTEAEYQKYITTERVERMMFAIKYPWDEEEENMKDHE